MLSYRYQIKRRGGKQVNDYCPFCNTEMEVHTTSEEEAKQFIWLTANEQSFWCPNCEMVFFKKSEKGG